MSTTMDQVVSQQVQNWMKSSERSQVLFEYLRRIESEHWAPEEVQLICNRWAARKTTLEDAYCWMRYWEFYGSGCVLRHEIQGLSSGPAADKMVEVNQQILNQRLDGTPFEASVVNGPGPRCDGILSWKAPLRMHQCFLSTDGDSLDQIHRYVLIPAGNVQLEIGTTSGPRSLEHLIRERGLARWPYEEHTVTLLLSISDHVPTQVLEDHLWRNNECIESIKYTVSNAPTPIVPAKADIAVTGSRGIEKRNPHVKVIPDPWYALKNQFKAFGKAPKNQRLCGAPEPTAKPRTPLEDIEENEHYY